MVDSLWESAQCVLGPQGGTSLGRRSERRMGGPVMPLPTAQPPAEQALPAPCLRRLAGLRLNPHCFIPGHTAWLCRCPGTPGFQGLPPPPAPPRPGVSYCRKNGELRRPWRVPGGSSSTSGHPLWAQTLCMVTGSLFKASAATRTRVLPRQYTMSCCIPVSQMRKLRTHVICSAVAAVQNPWQTAPAPTST